MHKAFGVQMHLELPFSWLKKILEGEYRVVPASVQQPSMPSMASLGTLATEICHLQNLRPLQGMQPIEAVSCSHVPGLCLS
jgi:hypothetical protein